VRDEKGWCINVMDLNLNSRTAIPRRRAHAQRSAAAGELAASNAPCCGSVPQGIFLKQRQKLKVQERKDAMLKMGCSWGMGV
jgi:hypothetical protein